jgi:predicted Zn-dependent protease|tara:strand:- start:4035 stop:5474 length:1440 start_codon:yes stop_codon:yes gene_type:complete
MRLKILLIILMTLSSWSLSAANDRNLPSLGDYTSGIFSLDQERALGQHFLRQLRAGAPLVYDPLLQEYLELLIYQLASNSQLQDRRIDLVIIDNKTINAFAAPGGIVGVNLGLFLYGEDVSEVSAILGHEIAHVSQRHFARRSEAGKKASLASTVGLLAGILLMATNSGDAGLAALTASQSIAQSEMLRYSRSREAEADRVGIDTLIESGMDPRAMARMFERLNRANRYSGRDIPEFMLTHPVTKSRIADSYAQTERLPAKIFPKDLDYQLMRTRIQTMTTNSDSDSLIRRRSAIANGDAVTQAANLYGLALIQTKTGQFDNAMQNIDQLRRAYPGKIAFVLAEAELHTKAERYDVAIDTLEVALNISPNNYPLSMAYAEVLMKNRQAAEAAEVLREVTKNRSNDQDVWYLLSEAYGLDRDIIGVHQARAEYFVLTGNFNQALKQLGFAIPLARDNFQENARITERMKEISELISSYDR